VKHVTLGAIHTAGMPRNIRLQKGFDQALNVFGRQTEIGNISRDGDLD